MESTKAKKYAVLDELSQGQRERLLYLEMHLWFSGAIGRRDLETRFGIKPAAASRDLAAYRELAPKNLEYDTSDRCYRVTKAFHPVFEYATDRVLAWLTQGFGDGLDLKIKPVIPSESPASKVKPDLVILASVARAIACKRPLRIRYLSVSSGAKTRDIVPVALADSGLRWHVRAFDRINDRFSDFVLRRIQSAEILDPLSSEHERLAADEQWTRIVNMDLVPHPDAEWPEGIEVDFDMREGCLKMRTRAALAGYLLQRWSVDCSESHTLSPKQHHLWLRNPQTLYGVESAKLAPGYGD